jgi:diguanylate cyclase (GGDEF)-like protein/PAS domain S-box-containing protein
MRLNFLSVETGEFVSFLGVTRDISDRKRAELDLHIAAIAFQSQDGMIVTDAQSTILRANNAFAQITGYQPEEVIGKTPRMLQSGRHDAEFFAALWATIKTTGLWSGEIWNRRKNGDVYPEQITITAVKDSTGQVTHYVAVLRDITERKHNEDRMRLSEKIFENTQEGILVTDASGVILTVNPAFSAVTGYTAEEALGRNPSLLNSGRHDQAFYQQMWQTIGEDGQWRGEIWNRRKNGEIYPEWINMSVIRDHEGTISHYVAIFSDITTAKANEERLKALAHFDSLTGLPNRFLFQDHVELALAQAARKGRQVAIMFLDIDHFKAINDSLGHRAGDTLLIEVAGRLSGCLRAGDTLGRVGGDEFSAVLPDLESPVAATIVAAKFIEALIPSFQIEGRALNVTTSIGIAVFPQHGAGLTQLSHAADAAMYQVKKQGRNAYRLWVPEYNDKPMSHSAVSIRQESGGSE